MTTISNKDTKAGHSIGIRPHQGRLHTKGPNLKRLVGVVLLLLSLTVFLVGYLRQYGSKLDVTDLVKDFYANVSTGLVSIAVTVLIIDYLSEKRAERELLQRLAREMGSKDNAFAMKAMKELRAHGWLTDGSLQGVDLDAADLSKSDLSKADFSHGSAVAAQLRCAYASGAIFHHTIITIAGLQEADFTNADFTHADLRWSDFTDAKFLDAQLDSANLEGAILVGTNVTLEQLRSAASLKTAVMPDGKTFEEWCAAGKF